MAHRFDLANRPLRLRVAGPIRTGLEVRFHRFGDGYEPFRRQACREAVDRLRQVRGALVPEVICPQTAHGEADDEDGSDLRPAAGWLGFGSRPYVATALLQLDQRVDRLTLTPDDLSASADRLGCADAAVGRRLSEMRIEADHFTARIHDFGITVLTVHMTIGGPAAITARELKPIIDCAVEATKLEVEKRFELVRAALAEAIFAAARAHRDTLPAEERPPVSYYVEDFRTAPAGDLEAARAEGYGSLIAFHRLFELPVGSDLPTPAAAQSASAELLEISHADGLCLTSAHPGYAAYLGYLNSVYLYPEEQAEHSRTRRLSPLPVIQFYEFAFAALQEIDRALFREIEDSPRVLEGLIRLSRTERETRYLRAQDEIWDLRERARLLEFRLDSEIDTLPPAHLRYWKQIVESWRIPALRAGIGEKVDFLEQHYGHMQQRMEADLTRRTNTIILSLTGITAFSVTADTLNFALSDHNWWIDPRNVASLILGVAIIAVAALFYWRRTQRSELSRLERARRRRRNDAP